MKQWKNQKFQNELHEISNRLKRVDLTFTKDTNFVYQSCSEDFAKILNKKNIVNVIGNSDFDLGWRDTCASVCRSEDEYVMSSKKTINDRVEYVVAQPDAQMDYRYAHLVVGFRKPIISSVTNEVVAICGSYHSVADMKDSSIEQYWQLNEKNKFYLYENDTATYLTNTEARFLLYLLNKPDYMKISDLHVYLHITKNSIYTYLRNIKEKLVLLPGETLENAVNKTVFYDHFKI